MKAVGCGKVVLLGTLCLLVAGGCKKKGAAMDGVDGMDPRININRPGEDGLGFDLPLDTRPVEPGVPMPGEYAPVYFAYDSSQISAEERYKADEVADTMRRNPGAQLWVEGHCDERGSREYNLSLGERRALAVRAYLVGLGIDGSRIQTTSFGEESPAAMGHDEESWRLNRRTDFRLYR